MTDDADDPKAVAAEVIALIEERRGRHGPNSPPCPRHGAWCSFNHPEGEPPDSGKSFDLSGVDRAVERLARESYDAARHQQRVAEEARRMTEGPACVPAWWREETARFRALESAPSCWQCGAPLGTTEKCPSCATERAEEGAKAS